MAHGWPELNQKHLGQERHEPERFSEGHQKRHQVGLLGDGRLHWVPGLARRAGVGVGVGVSVVVVVFTVFAIRAQRSTFIVTVVGIPGFVAVQAETLNQSKETWIKYFIFAPLEFAGSSIVYRPQFSIWDMEFFSLIGVEGSDSAHP